MRNVLWWSRNVRYQTTVHIFFPALAYMQTARKPSACALLSECIPLIGSADIARTIATGIVYTVLQSVFRMKELVWEPKGERVLEGVRNKHATILRAVVLVQSCLVAVRPSTAVKD